MLLDTGHMLWLKATGMNIIMIDRKVLQVCSGKTRQAYLANTI